jgi:membrane protease YdiL (CAAX protease family)
VLPSLHLAGANPALGSLFGAAATVLVPLLAVAGSAVAGVWLCVWRYAGRGLLAPIMVHLATNSGGLVVAWWLQH